MCLWIKDTDSIQCECMCVCASQCIQLQVSGQCMPLLLTILPYGSLKDSWLCTPRLLLRPHLKQPAGGKDTDFQTKRGKSADLKKVSVGH